MHFADSWFWIALLDPDDQDHPVAIKLIDEVMEEGKIVTSELVLTEVLTKFRKHFDYLRPKCCDFVNGLIEDENIEIIKNNTAIFTKAFEIFKQYKDKRWSIVDCSSMSIMLERNITHVLTFDGDFKQMGFVKVDGTQP